MLLFAVLPPMPLGPRIVCGVLGALVAGLLNLVFRRAGWRWRQFPVALGIASAVILAASYAGLSSGDRTEYVFLGAIVGIACIRGSREAGCLPDFPLRASVVVGAAVVLGPVMGLAFHYLRYQVGTVDPYDAWEIQFSLEDGTTASALGAVLMGIMVVASLGLTRLASGRDSDFNSPKVAEASA
jgi:hypothetical protein